MKIKTITRIFFMLITFLCSFISGNAQTTVYSNDFNMAENPLGTLNTGTPTVTWTNVTTGAGIVKTNVFPTGSSNYALQITNNAGAVGRTYSYGALSIFSEPFQETLSSNTNYLVWTFNIRTSRGATSTGFDTSNGYASAVVLCADGTNFLTANGYAVTLTRGTDKNAVRLVKFTGGLSANANVSMIIGPSAESSSYTDYYSVKVIYNPATNKWQLFSRIDGTAIVDPESGTLTQVGTETIDDSYTNTAMSHFGFFFNHQTTTNYYACFDNFKVVATPNITTGLLKMPFNKFNVSSVNNGLKITADNARIKIMNAAGSLISNRMMNGTYEISNLSGGLYMIQIETLKGIDVVKQLVK